MKTLFPGLLLLLCCSSCYYIASVGKEPNPSFENVKQIRYSEVRREFTSGLSVDKNGFQLEPEWQIYFTGDDSVKIFSSEKQKFIPYRIFHSHDDLFQFARKWYRVKHVSPDSIVLKAIEVYGREISEGYSDVYMTLYADDYIRKKLKTTVDLLRKPDSMDSLYVKYRAIQAGTHPDSAFSARNPVSFISKSSIIRTEKIEPQGDPYLREIDHFESYLNPEYKIYIDKAYRDFTYSFYAIVDHKGKITFKRFNARQMPEFIDTKTRVAKGIIDVYLKNLLYVKPGNTLGYPHSSVVLLHVIGRTTKL
jgi:hypothetical protein